MTSEYLDFSTFDAERGRMLSAVEVDRTVDREEPAANLGAVVGLGGAVDGFEIPVDHGAGTWTYTLDNGATWTTIDHTSTWTSTV